MIAAILLQTGIVNKTVLVSAFSILVVAGIYNVLTTEREWQRSSRRRKLFLSWHAVRKALLEGAVSDEHLDNCLFLTSDCDFHEGWQFDRAFFARVYPRLLKAAAEGRLAYSDDPWRISVTIAAANEMLSRHCNGRLQREPRDSVLYPDLEREYRLLGDDSIDVVWAFSPTRMALFCARQAQKELEAELAERGQKMVYCGENWKQEMHEAVAAFGQTVR